MSKIVSASTSANAEFRIFDQGSAVGEASQGVGAAHRVGEFFGAIEFEMAVADGVGDRRRDDQANAGGDRPRPQASRPIDEERKLVDDVDGERERQRGRRDQRHVVHSSRSLRIVGRARPAKSSHRRDSARLSCGRRTSIDSVDALTAV